MSNALKNKRKSTYWNAKKVSAFLEDELTEAMQKGLSIVTLEGNSELVKELIRLKPAIRKSFEDVRNQETVVLKLKILMGVQSICECNHFNVKSRIK